MAEHMEATVTHEGVQIGTLALELPDGFSRDEIAVAPVLVITEAGDAVEVTGMELFRRTDIDTRSVSAILRSQRTRPYTRIDKETLRALDSACRASLYGWAQARDVRRQERFNYGTGANIAPTLYNLERTDPPMVESRQGKYVKEYRLTEAGRLEAGIA